jgi:hypothetical protein
MEACHGHEGEGSLFAAIFMFSGLEVAWRLASKLLRKRSNA